MNNRRGGMEVETAHFGLEFRTAFAAGERGRTFKVRAARLQHLHPALVSELTKAGASDFL